MKRAFLLSMAFLCLRDVRASVSCSSTPCADGAAAAGVTSPVTTDPVVFNGASTFDKVVTGTLGFVTPSAGAANAVEVGTTAGCVTFESTVADANETLLCATEFQDSIFNLPGSAVNAGSYTLLANQSGQGAYMSGFGVTGDSSTNSYVLLGIAGQGMYKDAQVIWTSDAGTITGGGALTLKDTSIGRLAPGVVWMKNGGSSDAWTKEAGKIALAADFTNATATMASTTLSATLSAGRNYAFELRMFAVNSTAAEGIRIDYDGGTATATNFRSHCTLFDTALLLSNQTTAIATDVTVAVMTGASMVECAGDIEVNAAGTFIIRAAEATTAVGTLTVNRGSWLIMHDVTPSS